MARLRPSDRTLEIKVVYYGPALGGKTTNLETLHRIADPDGEVELISLDTHGDRTLFFDLLPLELPDVAGLRLKLRLFTVPGQVHYGATRRIVLRDADGCVFVADSSPSRAEANAESLQGLHANLVANGFEPGSVPIALQANKQDVPGALTLDEVRAGLGLDALAAHGRALLSEPVAAVAPTGEGVVETFERALRATLASTWRRHGLERMGVRRDALARALKDAMAPLHARARELVAHSEAPLPATPEQEASAEHVLEPDDLIARAVERSLDLAESLGDQHAVGQALQSRVGELETINELGRVLASCLDAKTIASAGVRAARAALGDGSASLLVADEGGGYSARAVAGADGDALVEAGGPSLAATVLRRGRPTAFADLEHDIALGDPEMAMRLAPYCTAAAVPVALASGANATEAASGMLVAYGTNPERRAGADALRFLQAIAAQLHLAFENAARHAALESARSHLEEEVAARTAELRRAHDELVAMTRLKDKLLSNVNHELRTPVTKLLGAAQVLSRLKEGQSPPPSLLTGVVRQAKHLAGLLDQALSAQSLLAGATADGAQGSDGPATVDQVVEAAVFATREKAADRGVVVAVESSEVGDAVVRGDRGSLTLLMTQVIDNAVKFTEKGGRVRITSAAAAEGRLRVLVADEGPGVAPGDAERIFAEFDQGSSDHLVAKPPGLGLGLCIARRIARRVGGEVGLCTDSVGRGATFFIEIERSPGTTPRARGLGRRPARDDAPFAATNDEDAVRLTAVGRSA